MKNEIVYFSSLMLREILNPFLLQDKLFPWMLIIVLVFCYNSESVTCTGLRKEVNPYGIITVKLLQEVVMATYILRTFTIRNSKVKKVIIS